MSPIAGLRNMFHASKEALGIGAKSKFNASPILATKAGKSQQELRPANNDEVVLTAIAFKSSLIRRPDHLRVGVGAPTRRKSPKGAIGNGTVQTGTATQPADSHVSSRDSVHSEHSSPDSVHPHVNDTTPTMVATSPRQPKSVSPRQPTSNSPPRHPKSNSSPRHPKSASPPTHPPQSAAPVKQSPSSPAQCSTADSSSIHSTSTDNDDEDSDVGVVNEAYIGDEKAPPPPPSPPPSTPSPLTPPTRTTDVFKEGDLSPDVELV